MASSAYPPALTLNTQSRGSIFRKRHWPIGILPQTFACGFRLRRRCHFLPHTQLPLLLLHCRKDQPNDLRNKHMMMMMRPSAKEEEKAMRPLRRHLVLSMQSAPGSGWLDSITLSQRFRCHTKCQLKPPTGSGPWFGVGDHFRFVFRFSFFYWSPGDAYRLLAFANQQTMHQS